MYQTSILLVFLIANVALHCIILNSSQQHIWRSKGSVHFMSNQTVNQIYYSIIDQSHGGFVIEHCRSWSKRVMVQFRGWIEDRIKKHHPSMRNQSGLDVVLMQSPPNLTNTWGNSQPTDQSGTISFCTLCWFKILQMSI